jgi:hypothetical protein
MKFRYEEGKEHKKQVLPHGILLDEIEEATYHS